MEMDDSVYENLLVDKVCCKNYIEYFNDFPKKIDQKITRLTANKDDFIKNEHILQSQLDKHFEQIQMKLNTFKTSISNDIKRNYENFEKSLGLATTQADDYKMQMEQEIKNFEQLVYQIYNSEENHEESADFNEDDALMINESMNDLESSQPQQRNPILNGMKEAYKSQMKNIFNRLETLFGDDKIIDLIIDENLQTITNFNQIRLETCVPDFEGLCFGHIEKTSMQQWENSPYDQLDHNKFSIEEKDLKNNLLFTTDKMCQITFSCPNTLNENSSNDDKQALHSLLSINIYDLANTSIKCTVKEKIASRRFIRLYFTPTVAGMYTLDIKFKNTNIKNGPFHFMVTSSSTQTTQKTPTQPLVVNNSQNTLNSLAMIKPEPQEPVVNDVIILENDNQEPKRNKPTALTSPLSESVPLRITAGRGRLLRMKDSKKSTQSPGLSAFTAHKRKSPSFHDLNNNIITDEPMRQDDSIKEIANKLKKVVVDESEMIYSVRSKMAQNQSINKTLISNHLRKHEKFLNVNGSVKLIDEKIPNLRAKFVTKYSNLNFPIGVRVCKIRNWVIVCDSGDNAVKIFNRDTGALLNQINGNPDKSKPNQEFTLNRPSAVLINNENSSEIFVKDDKEILVFNIEKNCQFVRKFGFKILRRPYGLAYNDSGNLVLVDADLRNPSVYVFDKNTGEVISSYPYQPALGNQAQSNILINKFSNDRPNPLASRLIPFEKTKIRFLCMNQNNLYASDLGRSIIFKTNQNGEIHLAFGHNGNSRGQLSEPSGIHVDHDGKSMLIGDSKNNRIQIYDANGIYKCDLEVTGDSIVRPSDIHLDSEGYLYVSCFINKNVKKFKIIED